MKEIKKSNSINNIMSINKNDNLALVDKNNRNDIISTYYYSDFMNQKRIKRFIKNVESRFRKSDEYKYYLGKLINDQNLNNCSVLGNINSNDATLEFHHYPFTLYDITEIIINKYIECEIKFNSFIIINELIKLHLNNKVGLVRLSQTVHELVHEGEIFLSLDSVFGKVNDFIDEYLDYIPEDLIKKYNNIVELDAKGKDDKRILNLQKNLD